MLGPGRPVKIVYDVDIIREEIYVRNSFTHEIEGNSILVFQTDPPFTPKDIGKFVIVTYLEKKEKDHPRFGFTGQLREIRKSVKFENGATADLILIEKLSDPFPYNLRRYVRVQIPSYVNIRFYLNGEMIPLIDLSVGGASFVYNKIPGFSEGEVLKARIVTPVRSIDLETKILRIEDRDFGRQKVFHISSEFVNTPAHVKNTLTTILFEVEKALRSYPERSNE
ncbi:MAG: PilZ domain-containing protein [Desulfobacterota bacterium]|nr:PilZ domain-containing protein [Thermodesulfobacteriota bacterium]MDW8002579.1 PilZ domain-containing protein [Deltaproteobacteria bacterium]